MKINKYFFTSIGFITGIVLGISIFGLLSFTSGPATPAPGSGIIAITPAQANSFFKSYMSGAASFNNVIKGFTVDKAQLEAMNTISRENPNLTGFRIYFGRDNNARKVGIVVGVDNTGMDAVKNSIFDTDSPISSPCPPICDVSSPITLGY